MASLIKEVESIAAYIESLFPTADIHYQQVPIEPAADTLVIRYIDTQSTSESGFHYRLDRTFQIVYFAKNDFVCMQQTESLESKLNSGLVIPILGSDRFLRLESFNLSQPFKTESGTVSAIIGVLSANLREAREQPKYPKIMNVDATVNE